MDEAGQKNPVIKVESAYPSCPCHSPTSFAEIEEEFELDVWPSQGESLGSGTHFKRIKSFLRTALEKTQREENEKGQKEIQDAIEMSKQGWIDQAYQAGAIAMKAKAVEAVNETSRIIRKNAHNRSWLEGANESKQEILKFLSSLPITGKEHE